MDKIKIMALGGLDEDGKDLYIIEINDDIFVFNAGFKYPTKLTPGIDFIIADFSYLKENKERIKAYIIPKAKKGSFGALPYIYKECPAPIYGTLLSKVFLTKFAQLYQQTGDFDFHEIKLPSEVSIGGYKFTFFSTCASMPLTFGFSIKTSLGNIVYSGDFIVEYNNEKYFKLDLNTLGKIAEEPTLILLSESKNSSKSGYCSPNHRLYPYFVKCFEETNCRCFVALTDDNLYHIDELFKACNECGKSICFYDKSAENIYKLKDYGEDYFPKINVVTTDDILRTKESNLVILITGEDEELYDKISLLCNGENELKQIRINSNDAFIFAVSPSDSLEVLSTATIDELYKTGCDVKYIKKKSLATMHAYEEDLRMLLSLLKPKYYFPIEGYYVDLLANAKIAFDMRLGLSHRNIFLLDNGQSLNIDENGMKLDLNEDQKHPVTGDLMIDGIGVGDVVNEIISERTRLGKDGVVVFGCAVSKKDKKIVCGPDIQMRGFLFLKDKDADAIVKEITNYFINTVNDWAESTKDFDNYKIEQKIQYYVSKNFKRTLNREPVVKPNIIIID